MWVICSLVHKSAFIILHPLRIRPSWAFSLIFFCQDNWDEDEEEKESEKDEEVDEEEEDEDSEEKDEENGEDRDVTSEKELNGDSDLDPDNESEEEWRQKTSQWNWIDSGSASPVLRVPWGGRLTGSQGPLHISQSLMVAPRPLVLSKT